MELIIFLICLLGILVIFAVPSNFTFISENQKWMEYFQHLARTSGLGVERNEGNFYPYLVGKYFGRPTKLEFLTIGGCEGVLPSLCARITIKLSNHPGGSLIIDRKNLFTREQIKIGDPLFEEEYIISGQPQAFVRKKLSSSVMRKILIEAHFDQLSTKGEELSMCKQVNCNCIDDINYCLRVLYLLANSVERIPRSSLERVNSN